MSPAKKSKAEIKNWRRDNVLLLGGGLLALIPLYFMGTDIYSSPGHIVPVYLLVMLCGVMSEYTRTSSFRMIFATILIAFFISLLSFLRNYSNGHFSPDSLKAWPYFFYAAIIFAMIVRHEKGFILKVNEGLVFLQSMAVAYWVIAENEISFNSTPEIIIISAVVLLLAFTAYQAFSYKVHSYGQRLLMSIFSAIIFLFFGLTNASQLINGTDIDTTTLAPSLIFITLQYFMLGVSSVYIAKSLVMVVGFFPGKNEPSESYRERVTELVKMHLERVDTIQINKGYALTTALFTLLIFGVNYFFGLLPPTFVIWCVFVSYPLVAYTYHKITLKRLVEQQESATLL